MNVHSNRIALITGASSGIGAATARALASAGFSVALAARRLDRLEALATEIGNGTFAIAADFSKESEAQHAVRETIARFGRIDVLVNNAGVMYNEPVETASLARWREMLELNVLGLIAATQAALPTMRAQKDGHIVNISSVVGRYAYPNGGAYSATKWGVNGFSEALRKEVYKDGIRVTVVEPGVTETELFEHIADENARTAFKAMMEPMRALKPEDIARVIAFCVTQPPHVNVNEVLVRPTDQER
jgi:NADP-dependent 3-hydroxy acid dehydrogenase YdfG